ncbi:MAG: hypothetical protein AAF485_19810, partial [Chloroflexota bacterium]
RSPRRPRGFHTTADASCSGTAGSPCASRAHRVPRRRRPGSSIQDDGLGFASAATHSRQSLGLHTMRERASELQGKLTVQSQIGQGTTIQATIPDRLHTTTLITQPSKES